MVTRDQLRELGLGGDAIDSRIRRSLLHPLHRGVYLAGHRAATWRALELAAILACGTGAILSHVSAARFWKLLPYPAHPDSFDVTVAGKRRAKRVGIRLHRRIFERSDWMVRDGVRVTTPVRTILDLASCVAHAELEHAINEAHVRRFVTPTALRRLIARNQGRSGIRTLRSIAEDGPQLTRSAAERRVLKLFRDAGLPLPESNVKLDGYEVDFFWREERLVIEADGWASHSSRAAFERDRKRDADLSARGYRVVRVTWRQLFDEPEVVVERMAATLAASPRRTAGSA